jgi:hypothetical protein
MADSLLSGGAVHSRCFSEVQPQRFFAHDMLAARDTLKSNRQMRIVGSRYDHGIDLWVGCDLVNVGREFGNLPVVSTTSQELLVWVADCYQLGPRIDVDSRNMVIVGDCAGSDDGQANGIGHDFNNCV